MLEIERIAKLISHYEMRMGEKRACSSQSRPDRVRQRCDADRRNEFHYLFVTDKPFIPNGKNPPEETADLLR